jgi:glycosyltransferase involved in cell wall biosynthesis
MKVLLLSPRTPARNGKGDQVRAIHIVESLAADHEVTVLTSGLGPVDPARRAELDTLARVEEVAVSRPWRAVGALWSALRGRPAQIGYMTPPPVWKRVRALAPEHDVVMPITPRAIAGALETPIVLDHQDAFALNLARRARGRESLPIRAGAWVESVLMRRWERWLSRRVAAQTVVSAVDARALPSPPEVVVVRIRVEPPATPPPPVAGRTIDTMFTGNMRYGPNLDAVVWLDEEIGPELWRLRPGSGIWLVGRDADGLRVDRRFEIRSDVPSIHDCLTQTKVALAPLRIGTGSPNKVLEAMAAGAAVVGTPAAFESLDLPAGAVGIGDSGPALARETARLLEDTDARAAMVELAATVLPRFGLDAQRESLRAVLESAVGRQPLPAS